MTTPELTETEKCLALYHTQMQQRDQQQVFQTMMPPMRFTPLNPYTPGITPEMLAMRRKFDILQYRGNSSGAGGGVTAAQSWARLARYPGSQQGVLNRFTQRVAEPLAGNNSVYTVCDGDSVTPLDRSGVPRRGDFAGLYLDKDVPQYQVEDPLRDRNYTAFTDLVPEPMLVYYSAGAVPTTVLQNNSTNNANPATWATIRFTAGITQPQYTLRVSVPLALTIGDAHQVVPRAKNPTDFLTVTVKRTLAVFFNDTAVKTAVAPDIVLKLVFVQPPTSSTAEPTPDSLAAFSITQYLGALTCDIPNFPAMVNSIYTVRVQCSVSVSPVGWSTIRGSVAANGGANMVYTTAEGQATLTPSVPVVQTTGSVALIL